MPVLRAPGPRAENVVCLARSREIVPTVVIEWYNLEYFSATTETLRDVPFAVVDHACAEVFSHCVVPERTPDWAMEARAVMLAKVCHEPPGGDHCVAFKARVRRVAALHVTSQDLHRKDSEADWAARDVVGPLHVSLQGFGLVAPGVARRALQVQRSRRAVGVHRGWNDNILERCGI